MIMGTLVSWVSWLDEETGVRTRGDKEVWVRNGEGLDVSMDPGEPWVGAWTRGDGETGTRVRIMVCSSGFRARAGGVTVC